jgi:hypothetical protein
VEAGLELTKRCASLRTTFKKSSTAKLGHDAERTWVGGLIPIAEKRAQPQVPVFACLAKGGEWSQLLCHPRRPVPILHLLLTSSDGVDDKVVSIGPFCLLNQLPTHRRNAF